MLLDMNRGRSCVFADDCDFPIHRAPPAGLSTYRDKRRIARGSRIPAPVCILHIKIGYRSPQKGIIRPGTGCRKICCREAHDFHCDDIFSFREEGSNVHRVHKPGLQVHGLLWTLLHKCPVHIELVAGVGGNPDDILLRKIFLCDFKNPSEIYEPSIGIILCCPLRRPDEVRFQHLTSVHVSPRKGISGYHYILHCKGIHGRR